jgi:hypothetical protein
MTEYDFLLPTHFSRGSYNVIGKNVVSNTPEDRKAVVNVPANQQITVSVNDTVAVYVSGDEISYTICDPAIMPQHTGWSESADWVIIIIMCNNYGDPVAR